ncbi:hypothetical protein [Paenibacillus sp. FSL M7-0420]|uniref:hypothetical protein n=1 Tax=Paenibacillus sp. FSL M7-0420 TaxID=2921609 RepID=UPI0030FB34E0
MMITEMPSRLLKDDGIFTVSAPNRSIANPSAYFVEQPKIESHKYEYTIVGQTFTTDYVNPQIQIVRQVNNLGESSTPYANPVISSFELVALGEVKDMNPLYVVAVCRKKRVLPLDN